MRRLIIALLFLAAAQPAHAQVAALPPRVIDMAERGLVPGGSATANRVMIQRAIDDLAALHGAFSSKVVLPAGDFPIDREIFLDATGVGLEGRGKGISRLIATTGRDMLVLGVSRRPAVPGRAPDMAPDHLVDLFGAGLLPGAARAPGQRYGFRTKADHHLAQQGGHLDTFPAGVTAITVELALDLSHLRDPGGSYAVSRSASLCGLTERGAPSPWELALGNDQFILKLRSDSGRVAQVQFGKVPDPAGSAKVTVQVDLAAGSVTTWVDDRKVPNAAALPADFRSFAANQHCPFGIGSNSGTANAVADYSGGASDVTFAGLRVTLAPVYAAADALSRIDGRPVNDGRYFAAEPATQGMLWLAEDPAAVSASRCLTVAGPGGTGSTLYALDNASHASGYASTHPGPVRGLSLVSGSKWGRGVALGFALGARFEDCEVLGGRDGIASINFGIIYPLTILDCDLAGADSPLYLYQAGSARVERVTLPKQFRCGLRLVNSQVAVRGLFAPAWGKSDHYVRAVGSSFLLEDACFDNEGDGGPQVAPIYVAPGGEYPVVARVNRCGFAAYRKDLPLALLDEVARPDALALRFSVADCPDVIRGGLGSGRIDARGTRWQVTKDW